MSMTLTSGELRVLKTARRITYVTAYVVLLTVTAEWIGPINNNAGQGGGEYILGALWPVVLPVLITLKVPLLWLPIVGVGAGSVGGMLLRAKRRSDREEIDRICAESLPDMR